MNILELKNISFSYRKGEFIKDLSISVNNSEFIGLIGPNGSGKSTILKLSTGILKPRSGVITLWGKPIYQYSGKERAKLISYLPQMLDINVPFTVKEVVGMGGYPYCSLSELSTDNAIEMVGLTDKVDSFITQLSAGERRRVFIAMTLLQGAGILLLDEPLANLDIKYQIELLLLLRRLKETRDVSIVMALHDIQMAFQFDFIFVVKNGRIVASGNPYRLITEELLKEVYEVDVKISQQHKGRPLLILTENPESQVTLWDSNYVENKR